MQIFRDFDEFSLATAGMTKWLRAAEAIRNAPSLPEEAMYSIGDSLTYLRTRSRYAGPDFVGHRRYLETIAALDSPVQLEVAPKVELCSVQPYSDLTDREHYTGEGRKIELERGQIAVVGIDEAVRYLTPSPTAYVVLHVTVEGSTFHNK